MAENFPAGTTTIRNLEPRFNYFLVVKPDSLVDDIPQKEYFVYKFKVSLTVKKGIKELTNYFSPTPLIECRELSDLAYSTEDFQHPDYINQDKEPLRFKMYEIPIYLQSQVRVIDLDKDPYKLGSKPPINIAKI